MRISPNYSCAFKANIRQQKQRKFLLTQPLDLFELSKPCKRQFQNPSKEQIKSLIALVEQGDRKAVQYFVKKDDDGKNFSQKADFETLKFAHKIFIRNTKKFYEKYPELIGKAETPSQTVVKWMYLSQYNTRLDDLPIHSADFKTTKEIHNLFKEMFSPEQAFEYLAQMHSTSDWKEGRYPIHYADLRTLKEIHSAFESFKQKDDVFEILFKMHYNPDREGNLPIHLFAKDPEKIKEIGRVVNSFSEKEAKKFLSIIYQQRNKDDKLPIQLTNEEGFREIISQFEKYNMQEEFIRMVTSKDRKGRNLSFYINAEQIREVFAAVENMAAFYDKRFCALMEFFTDRFLNSADEKGRTSLFNANFDKTEVIYGYKEGYCCNKKPVNQAIGEVY